MTMVGDMLGDECECPASGGSAPALAWTTIRISDTVGYNSGDLTANAYDPNSILDSVTEDADGWSVGVNNAASVDGIREGVSWKVDIFDLLGATDDGKTGIVFRVSLVTEPSDKTSRIWGAAAISDRDGDLSIAGVRAKGGGISYNASSVRVLLELEETSDSRFNVAALDYAYVRWEPVPVDRFGSTRVQGYESDGDVGGFVAMPASEEEAGTITGSRFAQIVFGRDSMSPASAQTLKLKFEAAAIQITP